MTNNNKNVVNTVEAGIVGAVVGAAVAATAVVLSDSKNRKIIGKKLNEYKKGGQKVYTDLKGKVDEMTSSAEEKVEAAKKAVKSKL